MDKGHDDKTKPIGFLTTPLPYTCSYEDRTCPYSPLNWKLQGYDPLEEYQYFDGLPDSADQRFLIDLETDSMEALYDVRPYLYGMGYWYDEMTNTIPAHVRLAAEGDVAIEAYYVRNGRAFLRAERDKGHGFFLADRNWSEYNMDDLETMPFCGCLNEGKPGDVGMDDLHPDHTVDMERALLKTNMRTPLPDREVMNLDVGGENWEQFVRWLYFSNVHPVAGVMYDYTKIDNIKFQRAMEGYRKGYMIKEGMYLYPNPHSIFPCSMRPEQARRFMAAGPGEFIG